MRLIEIALIRMMRPTAIMAVGLGLLLLSATASVAARAAEPPQQTFSTPEQAAAALADAWGREDKAQLLKIFGAGGAKLISSGDPVADDNARRLLASEFNANHKIEYEGDGKAVLSIGKDDFPLPIPLAKVGSAWHFDTKQGEQEILDRRIGRNELNAIEVCHAYVEAQREYAAMNSPGKGQREYARKFRSSPGRRDGLYWGAENAADQSPFGPLVASAEAEGYRPNVAGTPTPYHGYYFKILTRQGPSAAGGTKDYVASGQMTGGFAMIAFPAKYGNSGIMTFIVDQTGIVFEKNLGPGTEAAARKITAYDPDQSWKPAHQ
jgi:hypothetical protein